MIPLAIATLGAGALGAVGSYLNYRSQSSQLNWQKKQWEQVKQREDTAVQRRSLDLQRSGYNKILAASGQGATTSQAPILSAPTMDTEKLSKTATEYLNAITMDQQIQRSKADIQLTQSNILRNNHEMRKIDMEAYEAAIRAQSIDYDLDIARRTGQPYKDTTIMSPSGVIKSTQSAIEQARHGLKWLNNPIPPLGKPKVIRVIK